MKEYFKFMTLRKNLIPFILLMIFAIGVQLYGGGEWSIREMMISNFILVVTWVFGSLVSDWIQIKNNNFVGIKKQFITTFGKNFHIFILLLAIFITGQWHDGWSVHQIIKANFTVVVVYLFGSLVIDWITIKNNHLEE